MYYSTHYKSPLGDILLASDRNNIIGLWIGEQRYIENTMPKDINEISEIDRIPILNEGILWLDDYFAGKKPKLSGLAIAPIGSEFRQVVWKILTDRKSVV